MQDERKLFRLAMVLFVVVLALLLPLWVILSSRSMRGLAARAARGGQIVQASLGQVTASQGAAEPPPADPRLAGAYRFEKGGWIYLHLEGAPGRIGFQHGYLLAPEIADAFEAIKLIDTHNSKRGWEFLRSGPRNALAED